MLILRTAAEIASEADPNLRLILARYADMMDLATIYVVTGPADTPAALDSARGRPLTDWEFIQVHPGGWYEIVIVTADFGDGDVILVPDRANIDRALLNLCRDNAESGEGATS